MSSIRFPSSLRVLVVAAAACYIAVYLVLALIHLRYPFELEWMEGGSVDHVRRILAGKKLYVRPTLAFVPYIYTPLYFYVSAAVSFVTGPGFLPLRLVSVLASVGCIAIIARIVVRETGSYFAGLVAGGLYAATYRESVAFFDIGRVDSFFLLLFLGALYWIRFHPSTAGRAFAGLLLALAFLTKQSIIVAAAPIVVYVVRRDRRRSILFLATSAGIATAAAVALDYIHAGWFRYYIFGVPAQHPWVSRMLWDFWIEDMFAPLAPAFCFALLYLFVPKAAWQSRHPKHLYPLAALGAFASSWLGRLHMGGWQNVLMPAFAMLAILAGLGIAAAERLLDRASGVLAPRLGGLTCIVLLVQFTCLAYDPRPLIPTAADEAAGHRLIAILRNIPGDVWLPAHGYLPALAGKKTHAQEMAMNDIVGSNTGPPGDALRSEIRRAIVKKKFSAIIPSTEFYWPEITQSYQKKVDLFRRDNAFWPVTGMRARPRAIFVPKPDNPRPPAGKSGQ